MRNFVSKEDLLLEIGTCFSKMENGKLSLEELDSLVNHTKDLYERSIILRYKAMEEKVFGEDIVINSSEEQVSEMYQSEEDVEETPAIDEEEVNNTSAEELEELHSEQKAEPNFGFNLFDYPEEVKEEAIEEQPFSFSPEIVSENLEEETEPVNSDEEHVAEQTPADVNEDKEELSYFDKTDVQEEEVLEEDEIGQPSSFSYSELSPFIHKFDQVKNTASAQFGVAKIETLLGSFGLNERLQYINELFDGSSENFSNAVKILDNQSSLDASKTKVAELGIINQWEVDSETVEEFIQKVVRRYA
jgi:hypothetical protein